MGIGQQISRPEASEWVLWECEYTHGKHTLSHCSCILTIVAPLIMQQLEAGMQLGRVLLKGLLLFTPIKPACVPHLNSIM